MYDVKTTCKSKQSTSCRYNPDKENNYIMYYDANNLYDWAMSQPLPYSGFKWCDINKNITKKSNGKYSLQKPNDKVRILEVYLEYPKELHNDYPLAPEKIAVENEWLSEYQTELLENKSVINIMKLVPNLMDKKKYVVHYRNLHLYSSLGMKHKKVHRIYEFNEKPWMEPYIRLNKELQKKAMSAFEKDFYKLMNNSVFGKTMETNE